MKNRFVLLLSIIFVVSGLLFAKSYDKDAKNLGYGFSKIVDLSFEKTLQKVTDELKKEGFGIITEIDVQLFDSLEIQLLPYRPH